ncbi:MAG: S-layer homology domain-containing protein [Bacillota bacterium]
MRIFLTIVLTISMLLTTLFITPLNAQSDKIGFDLLGQIGGVTQALAVQGDYIYAGIGMRMVVLRDSNSGSLRQVGSTMPFPHLIRDIVLKDSYAYIACGGAGLRIVDISDPQKPVEISCWDSPGYAEGLKIADDYVYLADGPYGLTVIDVKDVNKPEVVSNTFSTSYAFDVDIAGSYAYIAAAGAGLLIADIASPSAPKELGYLNTPGYAYGVSVSDNIAYIADGWEGMRVINVENPATPAEIGYYKTPGQAFGIKADDKSVYIADAFKGLRVINVSNPYMPTEKESFEVYRGHAGKLAIADNKVYIADRNWGVLKVDVTMHKEPSMMSFYSYSVPIPANLPQDVISDTECLKEIGRLYYLGAVSFYDDGTFRPDDPMIRAHAVKMLMISLGYSKGESLKKGKNMFKDIPADNPAYPYIAAAINNNILESDKNSLFRPNDTILYSEALTMLLKGIHRASSDKSFPDPYERILFNTRMELKKTDEMTMRDFSIILSKFIFELPDGISKKTVAADVFRINNEGPAGYVSSISVARKYAYVAAGRYGFFIEDVSDPRNPVQIGYYDTRSYTRNVIMYGKYAIVSTDDAILTLDVSNPYHPFCAGYYKPKRQDSAPYRGMTLKGSMLYVADEYGLIIIDAANPLNLIEKGRLKIEEFGIAHSSSIDVTGNIAYLGCENAGIKIIDVSNSCNPSIIGELKYNNYNYVNNVVINDGKAYIADSSNELHIIDISEPNNPANLGSYVTSGKLSTIAIYKNSGIIADGHLGLISIDMSKPSNMTKNGEYNTPGFTKDIFISGKNIFVSDATNSALIFNINEKGANPVNETPAKSVYDYNRSVSDNSLHTQKKNVNLALSIDQSSLKDNGMLEQSRKRKSIKIYTVTNTHDSGEGSLRWCIENARDGSKIVFNTKVFSPIKPAAIVLNSGLPAIKQNNITIDASNAGVILDGSKLKRDSSGMEGNALISWGDGLIVKGLQIYNFPQSGIVVTGSNCIIGGDRTKGRGLCGEGNIISKNGGYGIWVSGGTAENNIIVGNNIGTDISGTKPMGNLSWGIFVSHGASKNIIGGTGNYRNLVSANDGGIDIIGSQTHSNTVMGNFVGTDITGTKDLGNKLSGVGSEMGAYNNLFKQNLICCNGTRGLFMFDNGSDYNTAVGNNIGVDITGTKEMHNKECDVNIGFCGTNYNRIGGTNPEDRNVINNYLYLSSEAENTLIIGNHISVNKPGKEKSQVFCSIYSEASHLIVGGTTPEEGNTIRVWRDLGGIVLRGDYCFVSGNYIDTLYPEGNDFQYNGIKTQNSSHNYIQCNSLNGVNVFIERFAGNTIRINSIKGNQVKGILLAEESNGNIPAPVITSVHSGEIQGTAQPGCIIEVFSDMDNEGQFYEGTALCDDTGRFVLSGVNRLKGLNITATATDSKGNTSEFSQPFKFK